MEIANIQERVTMHVDAAVGPAIDEKAAEELAVSNFTERVVTKSPALKKLLRSALRSIIGSQPLQPETLVDLLTLIDPVEFNGLEGAQKIRMFWAMNLRLRYKSWSSPNCPSSTKKHYAT